MPASQSQETCKMEGFLTTAKEDTQLKVVHFMERSIQGAVPPPPVPMTSKQAKKTSTQQWRSRRKAVDPQVQAKMCEEEAKLKKARAADKKAELRRAKARLPKPKKEEKLIPGQGFLSGFGFTGAKPKRRL